MVVITTQLTISIDTATHNTHNANLVLQLYILHTRRTLPSNTRMHIRVKPHVATTPIYTTCIANATHTIVVGIRPTIRILRLRVRRMRSIQRTSNTNDTTNNTSRITITAVDSNTASTSTTTNHITHKSRSGDANIPNSTIVRLSNNCIIVVRLGHNVNCGTHK